MKSRQIFFLSIFCLTSQSIKNEKPTSLSSAKQHSFFSKKISQANALFIPASLITVIAYNKQNLVNYISKNPITSLIGACLALHFTSEAVIKYKQIDHILKTFEHSQKINRYMMYAIAMKNTMTNISKKNNECRFYETEFFQNLTHQIPLSFQELEQLIVDTLQDCLNKMHELHLDIHSNLENRVYLLSKNHLTIEEVLQLSAQDPELYPLLENFYKSPYQYYQETLLRLNTLIKQHLDDMINN